MSTRSRTSVPDAVVDRLVGALGARRKSGSRRRGGMGRTSRHDRRGAESLDHGGGEFARGLPRRRLQIAEGDRAPGRRHGCVRIRITARTRLRKCASVRSRAPAERPAGRCSARRRRRARARRSRCLQPGQRLGRETSLVDRQPRHDDERVGELERRLHDGVDDARPRVREHDRVVVRGDVGDPPVVLVAERLGDAGSNGCQDVQTRRVAATIDDTSL